MMDGSSSPVQVAITMAKRAIAFDNGKQYTEALHYYEVALQHFEKALTSNFPLPNNMKGCKSMKSYNWASSESIGGLCLLWFVI